MSNCQRPERKTTPHSQITVDPKSNKYSLRDHCFKQKKTHSQKKTPLQYDPLLSSRFVQFISQHNNTLLTRNTHKQQSIPKEKSYFDCFQSANTVLKQESILTANKISHRLTISTQSSSSFSERTAQRQNSNAEEESVAAFRINTKSIMTELLNNSRYRQDTMLTQREEDSSFHIDLHSSRIMANGSKKISERNSSRKSGKKSLKNQKTLSNLNSMDIRKDSLTYGQLSDNIQLASTLKTPASQALDLQSSVNSISQIRANEKRKDHGCHYNSECRWVRKWMKQLKNKEVFIAPEIIVSRKELTQIEKDVPRTELTYTGIRRAHFQGQLKDILVNYATQRSHIGYVQGMNMLAGAILTHTPDITKSTAIFHHLMVDLKFQKIYENDFSLVQQLSSHLSDELSRYSYRLSLHLVQNDVSLEMFVQTWYFTMLGSFVPREYMPYVIDKYLAKGFIGLNQIILTLLIYLKEQMLESDSAGLMQKLSTSWLSQRSKTIDWAQLVECSDNVMLRPLVL